MAPMSVIPRKVSTDDCWLWARAKDELGYGRMFNRYGGKSNTYQAHRVMYENFVGPIPDGYQIDHLCEIQSCINPEHLEAVTGRTNTRRWWRNHPNRPSRPGRRQTICQRGHEFTPSRACKRCIQIRTKRRYEQSRLTIDK